MENELPKQLAESLIEALRMNRSVFEELKLLRSLADAVDRWQTAKAWDRADKSHHDDVFKAFDDWDDWKEKHKNG